MSYEDISEAISQEGLKPGEKYVLIAIADCRNKKTQLCFPGSQHLAEKTGYSTRQIKRLTKSLREKGYISVDQKPSPSGYQSNHYKFLWDLDFKVDNLPHPG